ITNYAVKLAPISDSQFLVIRSSPLQQTLSGQQNFPLADNIAQSNDHIIDLQIRSISGLFEDFLIRVRSQQELDNLRDQLGRPIDVLDSLVLPQPLHELFVDVFLAEVKLVKRCADPIERSEQNCRTCACRPMWCVRCMGRIFASKQDQQTPGIWMAGRAPCPTCRAMFCVLDVCLLDRQSEEEE
uniref:E3 ubiquitin-protein ligase n=1 Tax=Globodera pallida TaxID=36090 RepID=A0A183CMH9_GLOPA